MITTPTVFVVGAGASASYRLPDGRELLKRARHIRPDSPIFQLVRIVAKKTLGVPPEFVSGVIERLELDRNAPSIDAFLESRSGDPKTVAVGKMIIATLMGVAIRFPQEQARPSDNWLELIAQKMRLGSRGPTQFCSENRVTFVTFNYDSVIETRLDEAFRPSFDTEVAGYCSVIHVHGRLPEDIPPHQIDQPVGSHSQEWVTWLTRAWPTINVNHDEVGVEVLTTVGDAIRSATRVCFLGFAYHDANLRRLSLDSSLRRDSYQHLYGTAYGVGAGDRARIKNRLKAEITFGDSSWKCDQALHEFDLFD